MSRSCARPGCAEGAVATLSYAYADSAVWLEDLASEGHPMTHDLCELHATNVRVPRGWNLKDTRSVTVPGSEASDVSVREDDGGGGAQGALRLVGA
ncbi:MAG: DUF3499 family protein [Microthrixaceae bacterium]|nr:DUF3499 family protein [Microthrixaceae bacterium]MCB1010754.1 DUF3499 family protein [Microthrixaceae bacterium]MCO5320485.1 DUF3499 domain-containing protein [Microthrixaceae bacterium]